MTRPREVLIYPGSPKTGTTALQNTLRRSRDALSRVGWNYLHDPDQDSPDWKTGVGFGAGNGQEMARMMLGVVDGDPVAEFERLAPAGQRSIISSELLSILQPDQWRPILDLLEAEGGQIRTVYCFRDLYPFLWSWYNQVVSSTPETSAFSVEWLLFERAQRRIDGLFSRYLLRMPDHPCLASRIVLRYETIKSDAVRHMLEAGGLPVEVCDLDAAKRPDTLINRSLTQPELALMRQINANTDWYRAQWSGKMHTERPFRGKVKPVYVPEVHEWLEENFSEPVERFNDALPDGTDCELKILDESAYEFEDPDPQADQSPEYDEAIYHLLSFDVAEDYRDYLVSLLPGGVYDPPSPPGRLHRTAGRVKRKVAAHLSKRSVEV